LNVTSEPIIAPSRIIVFADPSILDVGESSDITASVFDESGLPMQNVIVAFVSDCSGLSSGSAVTNAFGIAEVMFIPGAAGICTINASVLGVVNHTTVTTFAPAESGTIVGTVTNVSGSVFSNAKVELYKNNVVLFTTYTDVGGSYQFFVPSDTYDVKVTYVGYLPAKESGVTVNPGVIMTKNYVLTKLARIYGFVKNETASPIPLSTLKAYRNGVLVSTVSSQANGAYEFIVPSGVYVVETSHAGYENALYTVYVPTSSEVMKNVTLYGE
jgi:hypothetical protein